MSCDPLYHILVLCIAHRLKARLWNVWCFNIYIISTRKYKFVLLQLKVSSPRSEDDKSNVCLNNGAVVSSAPARGDRKYSLYSRYHVWWSSSYWIFPFILRLWYRSQTLNIPPTGKNFKVTSLCCV